MASVAYLPYSTVQPRPTPPEDYQNIPTRPAEFGAQVGAAEERLGAGASQASRVFGQIAADDQVNHVLTGLDDLTTQFQSLRGKDALDQQPAIRKQMSDLLASARGNLSTPEQLVEFDRQSRYLYSRADREVGMHADQQMQVWGIGVNKSGADLSLNGIGKAAQAGDQDAVANHTQDLTNFRMKEAELTYGQDLSPEIRQNVVRASQADSAKSQVMAMLPTNPTGAQKVLDANSQNFNPLEYEALSQRLKGATTDYQAQQFVYGSPGPPGVGGAPQNNPGNIRPPGSATGFMSYPNQAAGVKEMSDNLIAYADHHGINTLAGVISRWSPPTENNTDALIRNASKETGFAPDQTIDLHDPATRVKIIKAIDLQEHGQSTIVPHSLEGVMTAPPTGNPAITAPLTAEDQQVPGLSSELQRLYGSDLSPQAKEKAAELVRLKYNSQWTDQTRAQEMRIKAQKDASDAAENTVIADAASDNPQISAQQIATNANLTPEAKLRMMSIVRGKLANDADKAKAVYGPGFWDAYKGITAAPGDSNRITDQSQIISRAGPGGDLTLAGVKELNQTLASVKRPEAAGDAKLQAGALAYAKHQLSFEADYGTFKVRDPKGEDAFNIGFLPVFMNYWQQGMASGKTPNQLADQASIDTILRPFKRSPADLMKDQLGSSTEASSVPGSPSASPSATPDLASPQGLIAAVRSGQIPRDQGEAIALKNGWIRADPAPPIARP